MSIVDKYVLLKTKRVKYKHQPHMFDADIIQAIHKRDYLKTSNMHLEYKQAWNIIIKLIRKARKHTCEENTYK